MLTRTTHLYDHICPQGVTTSLNRLDMAHNLFHAVPPAIATLQQLDTLNMNHNCLDEVTGEAFPAAGAGSLGALDLSSSKHTTAHTSFCRRDLCFGRVIRSLVVFKIKISLLIFMPLLYYS